MIRAKNYETVSKFVKVMTKILWPLFSRTRCKYGPKVKNAKRNRSLQNVAMCSTSLQMTATSMVQEMESLRG